MIRVLCVCLGNVCRSPMAQAALEKRVAELGMSDVITVDSAGTDPRHLGESPDERSQKVVLERGYDDISSQAVRRVLFDDGKNFDYFLVMDQKNFKDVFSLFGSINNIHYLLSFCECEQTQLADPYYSGSDEDFEKLMDLIECGVDGFVDFLIEKHKSLLTA